MAREKALQCLRAIHLQECAKFKENLESHPDYEKEKSLRNSFLISKGFDVHTKALDDDWNIFWKSHIDEILQKEWENKKYHCLAEFQEKEVKESPLSSISSNSSHEKVAPYKKRSSSASSRSSCEKKRRKIEKFNRHSSSAKYISTNSSRQGSNVNETVICDVKEHSYRRSSKTLKKHHISKKKDTTVIKNYKFDDNNIISKISDERYYQEYADKLSYQSDTESDKKITKNKGYISPKVDSLKNSDPTFENVSGNLDEFDNNMQNDDFKPMQRKNIKLTLKGDKLSESSLKHSNNQDDLHRNKILAGNAQVLYSKTDIHNLEIGSFSKNYLRNLYEAEITKKANIEDSAAFHTIPLNLPLSTNVAEDSKINIASSSGLCTSINIFAKHTEDKSADATIEEEAVELLGLFHSLSSHFGVLSVPITLLHEKFLEYKKEGSSLIGCFDDDAIALLEMISNKLNNFLKAPDISLVQSTVFKLASRRLTTLIAAVDKALIDHAPKKPNTFLYGLDLFKIATACAGKDCSDTVKFIKISLIYQNLPELSSDQIMEVYIAVKSIQASSFSKSKSVEIVVPKSPGAPLSYDTSHPCFEKNSSSSLSKLPVKELTTLEMPSNALKKVYLSPQPSSHKPTKSSISDGKTKVTSTSNKDQNSSYVLSYDKEETSKSKQQDTSNLSKLKKSERLSSSKHKSLSKEHSEPNRSRSPNQKASSKRRQSKSTKSYSRSPLSDQKKSLRSYNSNSSKTSPLKQKESIVPSKLQKASFHSHSQTKTKCSSIGKKKSSTAKTQSSSQSSASIQKKCVKGNNHNLSQPPSSQKLSSKTKHYSFSPDKKDLIKVKHSYSSPQSSPCSKTKKNNHISTRLSTDIKTSSRMSYSSYATDAKESAIHNKGDHYHSLYSPTSENQKLSSTLVEKNYSSKYSFSHNKRDKNNGWQKNSYYYRQQNNSRPAFSLSLVNAKPTPLPMFNVFGNFNDDNNGGNTDNDKFKNNSRKTEYVFAKREPVESFLINCRSPAEGTYIRKLYKQIHNMDLIEKIKYYIDYNSHSENVKKLLAVHADEIALVDPNLAQSMKWRIKNLSIQNMPRPRHGHH